MAGTVDPWWVIGSAAVALHGADGVEVGDVDVLSSERDASAVLARLGVADVGNEGTALFRSAVFGRWEGPLLTVEFMAGFRFCGADGWRAVWPVTREAVMVDGFAVFVPGRAELAAMLFGFGRPKDLARAKALSPSGDRVGRGGER
ncbi:hypothetical protein JAO74_00905 [Sphingomonas sp. BT553]|uniref:Uncharacterized protein n=2 Tax=Sphingomonas mollis TaxID=2795726 RepID=A0ABS0XJX5_9SPHN|nr:hypothetical protein [Sphingomonas sp. BT553]